VIYLGAKGGRLTRDKRKGVDTCSVLCGIY
jgi:hypothetical protein